MHRETPINMYLLSRCAMAAESLRMAFGQNDGFHLRGCSAALEDARSTLDADRVDIVLIDTAECEGWALSVVHRLAEEKPFLKLLPIGIGSEAHAVELLEAGASGFSMRSDSFAEACSTIRGVVDGEPPCPPRVVALIHARIVELSRRAQASSSASPCPPAGGIDLSRREREVLGLLAHGRRNKEIARDLGIALSTAGKHVQRILGKLEVHRRRDAIRRAYEQGILDCAPPFVAA